VAGDPDMADEIEIVDYDVQRVFDMARENEAGSPSEA
jgi:hypothetical protein